MKELNNFINEKLVINKNIKYIKLPKLPNNIIEKFEDILCQYFQHSCTYLGKHYDSKLQLLENHFNNDILSFFDIYDIYYLENKADDLNIDLDNLIDYIKLNNDDLYKIIKDFVL